MRRLPYWVDGALFGTLFVPLIFFLKIICPLDVGCFADPFFIPIFSPLFLLENLFSNSEGLISPKIEIFFIVLFWGVVGSLLAHLWGKIVENRKRQDFLRKQKTP